MHRTSDDLVKERAILVGVGQVDKGHDAELTALHELHELAKTAGVKTVGRCYQRRAKPDTTHYIGSGKASNELRKQVQENDANVVLFDNDLTPSQVRNLEELLGCKVIDRSEIILDIFATHAKTVEAKLQVELAQLRYTLPRLKRMWTHLSRIAGQGGIGSRGPGEKQIETDRRLIDRRLHALEMELKEIRRRKKRQVATRSDDFTVALVGYTNAGKSTLMNRLTGAGVYQADQLFATLDTKTSDFELPNGSKVLLSDTVGFIDHLPHHLVASFHATLEEVRQAKVLIHLVDASQPEVLEQIKTVERVLHEEMKISGIEEMMVFNKIDKIDNPHLLERLRQEYPNRVELSAKTGEGVEDLLEALIELGNRDREVVSLEIPAANGKVQAELSSLTEVLSTAYEDDRVKVVARIPQHLLGRFDEFILS